jgi:hypothetical protein
MVKLLKWRAGAAALPLLAPLAVGAVLLSPPRPAAAAPAAQGAPATKDDCKDGGWRAFSALGFKNQGECVSFVNHSGGGGVPVDPAATPELGSLLLFAGGAAGLGGYALAQARRRLPRRR